MKALAKLTERHLLGVLAASIGVGVGGGLLVLSRLDDDVLRFILALLGFLGALTAVRQVVGRSSGLTGYNRLTYAGFGATTVLYLAGLGYLLRPGTHSAPALGPFALFCIAVAAPMLAAGHVTFYGMLPTPEDDSTT